jgi:hypothetical protein
VISIHDKRIILYQLYTTEITLHHEYMRGYIQTNILP